MISSAAARDTPYGIPIPWYACFILYLQYYSNQYATIPAMCQSLTRHGQFAAGAAAFGA